jgi:hypothetical protein
VADQSAQQLGSNLDELTRLGAYDPGVDLVAMTTNQRTVLDGTLRAIASKLEAWQAETDRIEAEKAAQLATLDTYAQSVRGQASRYSTLRRTLQDFMDRVDTVGVSFDEAYAALSDAGSQRTSVRANLAGLNPPAAVAGAHNGLLDVLDTAVSAIDDAIDGTREYEASQYSSCPYWDEYCYDDDYYLWYKDTPGWQTFTSKSDAITSSYDSALRSWESAVASERSRIEATPLPPKPAV